MQTKNELLLYYDTCSDFVIFQESEFVGWLSLIGADCKRYKTP